MVISYMLASIAAIVVYVAGSGSYTASEYHVRPRTHLIGEGKRVSQLTLDRGVIGLVDETYTMLARSRARFRRRRKGEGV
ncbi:hypothetical protein F5B18DRAFT_597897 [Nemania serpens]|nr:hypothetical protein F5B18DRAFT_597897 [Nemania serpens]